MILKRLLHVVSKDHTDGESAVNPDEIVAVLPHGKDKALIWLSGGQTLIVEEPSGDIISRMETGHRRLPDHCFHDSASLAVKRPA